MLKRFTVSNFKNFKDKLIFRLDDPANYAFNSQVVQNDTKMKGVVFGINGSGKSNLALALFDIVLQLTDKEKLLSRYRPYLNLDAKSSVAEFEYVFEFNGLKVVYEYTKTDMMALAHEKLTIGDTEVLRYDFTRKEGYVDLEGAESLQVTSSLQNEADAISRVKFVKSNAILQDNEINRAFTEFMAFVDNMLMFYSLDQNGYQGLSVGPDSYTRGIIREGKLTDFQAFLKKQGLELNLVSVDVDGQEEMYCKFENAIVPFAQVASTGTRSLALFYYWFIRMSKASLVCIDEFDAFYHFELAEVIVRMLRDLEGTQVFLTTHNTDLLSNDLMRPDVYFYLQEGRLKSIDQLTEKELRSAHNLQKMFKAGSFDA